jgi:hypothetical protein
VFFSFSDFERSTLDTLQKIEYHQAISNVNFLIMESQLKRSKDIQERISNLEKSELFLSETEIDNELKNSEQLCQQVLRVSEQIMTLKKDASFLDLNQIQGGASFVRQT